MGLRGLLRNRKHRTDRTYTAGVLYFCITCTYTNNLVWIQLWAFQTTLKWSRSDLKEGVVLGQGLADMAVWWEPFQIEWSQRRADPRTGVGRHGSFKEKVSESTFSGLHCPSSLSCQQVFSKEVCSRGWGGGYLPRLQHLFVQLLPCGSFRVCPSSKTILMQVLIQPLNQCSLSLSLSLTQLYLTWTTFFQGHQHCSSFWYGQLTTTYSFVTNHLSLGLNTAL